MFTNSLFKDFLEANGLKVWHEESTRDIICLEFNYGSRSYQQELDHLYKVAKSARAEYRRAKTRNDSYLIDKANNKRNKITELLYDARQNKLKYTPLSKDELRQKLYNEGVNVEYISRNHTGVIQKRTVIHYKMLYRSTGKAKKGSCMFICDRLYKKAIKFLHMGIRLPTKNPMIVEISAYAPLVSSGIVGKLKINPRNILILKDVDSFFETNVISIETDESKRCIARRINQYKLKNTLFDGQALIDSRIFPDWANGYVLLRHHFCKMAAFNTNIQEFFKDYFGVAYSSAVVTDMFGNEHYAKDIELITTDNSMKWLKFDISYNYWCEKVFENNCMFGIVKTAHSSKLGRYQKMSYQMVNSLDNSIMPKVVSETVEYVERLKSDNDFFLNYLKHNSNFSNDYDALIALCNHNPNFINSSYYRDRKKKIISSYVLKIKSGEIILNAENLTIVGSPYAMLLYAATGSEASVGQDITFRPEPGTIQCYTERFGDGEYLAFFRSPFNSKNNLTYLHNVYHENLKKYFNFGKQIIAVNLIGTDFQDRNNGSDQDSDFAYTTNHSEIVEHARQCYLNYPTIVNNIPKEKNVYVNTMDAYAAIDNALAKSQTDIGESSNLAQIAQTYACNFEDQKFADYVCILSVLAQVAIDNAKRRFDINLTQEIKRIKDDMDINIHKYPTFWGIIKYKFNRKNINKELVCPMNYLSSLDLLVFRNSTPTIPIQDLFVKHKLMVHRKTSKKVEDLITKYSFDLFEYQKNDTLDYEDSLVYRSDFDALIQDINKIKISNNYIGLISWLLGRAFSSQNVSRNKLLNTRLNKNKSILVKVLYEINPKSFLKCFISCKK